MNVTVVITVGAFAVEANVEDCGPDALGDALRQITTHTLALVGVEDVKAAAGRDPKPVDEA